MFSILPYEPKHKRALIELFNRICQEELPYKPWTDSSFDQLFTDHPHFRSDLTFIATINNEVVGFSQGVFHEKTGIGFITFVLTRSDIRRQGIGTALLKHLEDKLLQFKPKRIDCSFFNPIQLTWYIPNTPNHEHPNAPGVPYPSAAYHFFIHHGYKEITTENAYHLDLKKFIVPESIHELIETLREKGVTYTYFDPNNHQFGDLFDQLGNELWREEIMHAVKNNMKVLVPVLDGMALGFTGPIYPQDNGRGYFAGIGVHPKAQGQGIGKALFFLLCQHEKELGAKYMTLFTGENNPARRMYEKAGFTIAHAWKVMRKTLD